MARYLNPATCISSSSSSSPQSITSRVKASAYQAAELAGRLKTGNSLKQSAAESLHSMACVTPISRQILYGSTKDLALQRRQAAAVSRGLALLRAHGILCKVNTTVRE